MEAFNNIAILIFIIAIGYLCRKKSIISQKGNKELSKFLLDVTMPFLIYSTFNIEPSPEIIKNMKNIALYSFIIHMMLILFAKIFEPFIEKDKYRVMKFAIIFSNSGFMGYPVLESLYGKMAVFYASVFVAVFNLFMMSYGVAIFNKEEKFKFKSIIKNNGMIAILLGSIMLFTGIKPPVPIMKGISLIGSMTTPLSLIIIGCIIGEGDLKEIFKGYETYFVSFLRLIICPILVFCLLKIIGASNELMKICVVLEGMPVAALCAVYGEKYDMHKELCSKMVFISTLISIVTIPILVLLI